MFWRAALRDTTLASSPQEVDGVLGAALRDLLACFGLRENLLSYSTPFDFQVHVTCDEAYGNLYLVR